MAVTWFKRFYPDAAREHWQRLQNSFGDHIVRLGGPREMMLVVHRLDEGDMLYMALPVGEHPYSGDGFEEISRSELPKTARLQVGDEREFSKLFEPQLY